MNYQLYKATDRGQANFGWLQANFTFSFGNYYNPDKIQFGALRVLNDDTIAGGTGFGSHPHENMEIITIPLEGALRHTDNMGNSGVIGFGEVQVMSAGTGVQHSEMNASETDDAKTLQLWVFPEIQDVGPRYDQKGFLIRENPNNFVTVVSPHNKIVDNSLWIYQQAYISIGTFEGSRTAQYEVNIEGNGVFIFLLDGGVTVSGQSLMPRDAMGVTDSSEVEIIIDEPSAVLIVEVPMYY